MERGGGPFQHSFTRTTGSSRPGGTGPGADLFSMFQSSSSLFGGVFQDMSSSFPLPKGMKVENGSTVEQEMRMTTDGKMKVRTVVTSPGGRREVREMDYEDAERMRREQAKGERGRDRDRQRRQFTSSWYSSSSPSGSSAWSTRSQHQHHQQQQQQQQQQWQQQQEQLQAEARKQMKAVGKTIALTMISLVFRSMVRGLRDAFRRVVRGVVTSVKQMMGIGSKGGRPTRRR